MSGEPCESGRRSSGDRSKWLTRAVQPLGSTQPSGWSDLSITKRYMHVTDELVTAIAHEVGELPWTKRPAGN